MQRTKKRQTTATSQVAFRLAAGQTSSIANPTPPNWSAETGYFVGGTTYADTGTVNLTGLTDPAPHAVYLGQRYGEFSYTIPGLTPSTVYAVRLHFAEFYYSSAGLRPINVSVNGTLVLQGFDIYATAGGLNKACATTIAATSDSTGKIILSFTATNASKDAKVCGIEVTGNISPNNTPQNLAGQASSTYINLTWNAPLFPTGTINGYNVYQNGAKLTATAITATSYKPGQDSSALTPSTQYTFVVKPVINGVESNQSASLEIATTAQVTTPSGFVTRTGQKLYIGGTQWRTTGFNLAWSFGCGSERNLTPTYAEHEQLFANAHPGSLYRIFAWQNYGMTKLDQILNQMRPYGHKAIVVLSDYAQGCAEPYCGPYGSSNNATFINGGWKNAWRDQWLTPVVNKYKNDPVVAMWEWSNEPLGGSALRTFFDEVGAYVRNTLGDTHIVGSGMHAVWNSADWNAQNSTYIDVISRHDYREGSSIPSDWMDATVNLCNSTNKPFIFGEIGVKPSTPNRYSIIQQKMDSLKNNYPMCAAFVYWTATHNPPSMLQDYDIWIGTNEEHLISNYNMV